MLVWTVLADYVLVTKFYNERENIPRLLKNIADQTLKPRLLIFIDDGSTDKSADFASSEASRLGLDSVVVSMPMKPKGNLDTLGRAWNKAQPEIIKATKDVGYVAMTDVDTQFPKDYFETMLEFMEENPRIGVVAGQVAGQPRRTFPMFTGKVARSEILRKIERYWDISVDSFVNVKALQNGFELHIMDDVEVQAGISHLQTKKGRFRAGRLAYYSGVRPLYAMAKGVARFDSQFLRGYWTEASRGTWQCKDQDILDYYRGELGRKLVAFVRKTLRL